MDGSSFIEGVLILGFIECLLRLFSFIPMNTIKNMAMKNENRILSLERKGRDSHKLSSKDAKRIDAKRIEMLEEKVKKLEKANEWAKNV